MRQAATASANAQALLGGGDYPTTWDEFIGQGVAKLQLRAAAMSARMRGAAMDHILLASGRPGCGKTTLALLTAAEKGSFVTVVSGKVRMGEARLILSDMQDGDVLIIDEIHQLLQGGKVQAEWLLNYLQDGVLLGPLGPEEMPKVTIIGCTTEGGKLQQTITDRFVIKPDIVEYAQAEAALIAEGMARRLFGPPGPLPLPSKANFVEIGEASSRSPRVMKAILITLRDIALTTEASNWLGTEYSLTEAFEWMGLTSDGLDKTCQRYLHALLRDFRGEPAGLTAMTERLQEPGGLAQTERVLLDKGLMVMTKSGRMLTQPGLRRARELERDAAVGSL